MPINNKTPNDFGYVAIYKGKQIEVYAPTSYQAQLRAQVHFRCKQAYQVAVCVCEDKEGNTIYEDVGVW